MKVSLDEPVFGWKCRGWNCLLFWMKWFWTKVFLDESVFGWKCFWMSFFAIWMKVYLTSSRTQLNSMTSTPGANLLHHCKCRREEQEPSNSPLAWREFSTKCAGDYSKNGETWISVKRTRTESRIGGWNSHVRASSPTRANSGRSKIWDPKVWRKTELRWKLHSQSEKSDWFSRLGSQTYSWRVHGSQSR